MFALFVTVKIKPGHRDEFIEATMGDAIGSNNDEPGCIRFDVHADPTDENTVYLYEVYKDRESWNGAHRSAPHYTKWRETVGDWFDGGPQIVELNPIYNAEAGRV
ncbi:MAG: antibiotic biosynthesis monooxygenase [SAR202 cluster bacterium]|nr:antibiotic biosynthesis monooxygenase [SAR202 cluster bacterium]